ncbi:unnamed protein product, partial [Phaeothamnion confervicola]
MKIGSLQPFRSRRRRRGIVLAEAGIIYSVAISLVMGAIVIGFGIFRFQQIPNLAGEGARWASIRATTDQDGANGVGPTAQEVLENAVFVKMVMIDKSKLTSTLVWNKSASPKT